MNQRRQMLPFGCAEVLLLLESPFELVDLGLGEEHASFPSLSKRELHRADAHADADPDADAHPRRFGHVAHRLAHRTAGHIGPACGTHQSRDCKTY